MNKATYTIEDLIQAVKESTSVRQVILKLNLKEAGGNFNSIKIKIKDLNLDTSHFRAGNGWSKGLTLGSKTNINDYLNNKIKITSYKLKLKLFKENLKQEKCESCNLSEWLCNPIPLELDHIDGNKYNNNLSNLRILCPNCHALTPTYRTKNIGAYSK